LDARFSSDWDRQDLSQCADNTVGAAIRAFIAESGMAIDFMFRGEPADDFMYLNKRRAFRIMISNIW
ncbi:hypothetical protein, partial [Streptococcus pneumoniae]|uniref:hypothetical protein n=1 Tax=Streptococcus pneumoniae TaxID=1313 RepID=UPI001E5A41A6